MKIFDFERAIQIVLDCVDIFGRDWIKVEAVVVDNIPCLRVGYKNEYLDFSCYKYC